MTDLELLAVPMAAGGAKDIYSGVARLAGKLWAGRRRADGRSRTVVVIVHPSSNFLGHYLLAPLSERGVDAVGMNTRYLANDSCLIMENCVLDIAATVQFLREECGYEKVILVGNSGGGGLAALYQSQAERPDITSTPAGDGPDLTQASLPEVDGLVELMAHPGRAITYTDWLDAAIIDEHDPFVRDLDLDIFDERNGPPYSPDFIRRYRAAQLERNRSITEWVRGKLVELATTTSGTVTDLPFTVHGTCADPRFLDLTLEPSDRETGTLWGDTYSANFAPSTLGHLTSLRSWLSQWSVDESNSNAYRHLARVSIPVLVVHGTADKTCTPEQSRMMYDAVTHDRKDIVSIAGARHYFDGQPELIDAAADAIVTWLDARQLR
jgi:alpha-beta hydrolase superfamily lysophospholipase